MQAILEQQGTLSIRLVLHRKDMRLRLVQVFTSYGSRPEAIKAADEFLEANRELARLELAIEWQPHSERVTLNDIKEELGQIARVKKT